MDVSTRRLAANGTNAEQSTGPTSSEGKARSSRNAVTHGLTSRRGVITTGDGQESLEEYERLFDACVQEFEPETPYQALAVHGIAELRWAQQRAQVAATGVLRRQRDSAAFHARTARANAVQDAVRDFEKLTQIRVASELHQTPEYPLSFLHRRALFQTSEGLTWVIEFLRGVQDMVATEHAISDTVLDRIRSMYGIEHEMHVACAASERAHSNRDAAPRAIAVLTAEIDTLGRSRTECERVEALELAVQIDVSGFTGSDDLAKVRRYEKSYRNQLQKEIDEYWRHTRHVRNQATSRDGS